MVENPQAFPTHLHPASKEGSECAGMSLRDWLAGQALAGPVAALTQYAAEKCIQFTEDEGAETAYRIADAMLAARTQSGSAEHD